MYGGPSKKSLFARPVKKYTPPPDEKKQKNTSTTTDNELDLNFDNFKQDLLGGQKLFDASDNPRSNFAADRGGASSGGLVLQRTPRMDPRQLQQQGSGQTSGSSAGTRRQRTETPQMVNGSSDGAAAAAGGGFDPRVPSCDDTSNDFDNHKQPQRRDGLESTADSFSSGGGIVGRDKDVFGLLEGVPSSEQRDDDEGGKNQAAFERLARIDDDDDDDDYDEGRQTVKRKVAFDLDATTTRVAFSPSKEDTNRDDSSSPEKQPDKNRSHLTPFIHFKEAAAAANFFRGSPALLFTPSSVDVVSGCDTFFNQAAQRNLTHDPHPFETSVADSLLSSFLGPALARTYPPARALQQKSTLPPERVSRPAINIIVVGYFTTSPFVVMMENTQKRSVGGIKWAEWFLGSVTNEIGTLLKQSTGVRVGPFDPAERATLNEVMFRVVDGERLVDVDKKKAQLFDFLREASRIKFQQQNVSSSCSKKSTSTTAAGSDPFPPSKTMVIVVKDTTLPDAEMWHSRYGEVLEIFTQQTEMAEAMRTPQQPVLGVVTPRGGGSAASTAVIKPIISISKIAIAIHIDQSSELLQKMKLRQDRERHVDLLQDLPRYNFNRFLRVDSKDFPAERTPEKRYKK